MTKLEKRVNVAAVVLPFAAFLAAILLLWNSAVSATDLAILGVMYVLTGLGVTVGFHRLLTHRSFQVPKPLEYTFAVLGSMFMFRLILYMYEVRHAKERMSPTRALAYFFLLPNVAFPLFPEQALYFAPWLGWLAVIGIIYGALVAMVQPDFKKLVAYSSVSHLGFVMLGIFALTVQSVQGALMVMINHGISTGALFFLVGMIYERRHSRLIDSYGGIARVVPMFAAALTLAPGALAPGTGSTGIPAATHASTSSAPGSDTPGVPASLTSASCAITRPMITGPLKTCAMRSGRLETHHATSAVSARPGPKARKNSSFPARRAAAPQATIRPAVATMGRYWPVAPIAASTGASSSFRPLTKPGASTASRSSAIPIACSWSSRSRSRPSTSATGSPARRRRRPAASSCSDPRTSAPRGRTGR